MSKTYNAYFIGGYGMFYYASDAPLYGEQWLASMKPAYKIRVTGKCTIAFMNTFFTPEAT